MEEYYTTGREFLSVKESAKTTFDKEEVFKMLSATTKLECDEIVLKFDIGNGNEILINY